MKKAFKTVLTGEKKFVNEAINYYPPGLQNTFHCHPPGLQIIISSLTRSPNTFHCHPPGLKK
jgi:hypothetical protein